MKKLLTLLTFAVFMFFGGCAQKQISVEKTQIPKKIEIIPFANLTQTPMAGYRVSSIALGVLKEYGFTVTNTLTDFPERDYSLEEINKILSEIKDGYVFTGYVNEFKYKAGIDAQPAVSLTIRIYDAKNKKNIYVSTVSEIGSSYDSLGTLTQRSIKETLDESVKK